MSLNSKQLLNDISNTSKGLLATFAKNPSKLAEAAFEAKKLGSNIKEVESISSSLLNIESSIASEFEAEVMTGKQLNLERARYYALTNDIAGVSKELVNQGIDLNAWSGMNVIQQESMAKAMGMSREQMGSMLIEQTALTKLGSVDGKNAQEKYNNLVRIHGVEKAQKMLGDEDLANQLQSTSTQERFLALTEKLKETFISIAGPIMDIVSPLMDLVSFVLTPISQGFQGIKAIIDSIISPTESLSETLAKMGPLTAFIAGALTAAGVAVTASLVPGLIRTAIVAATAVPSLVSMAVAAISTASAATLGIGAVAIVGGIAAAVVAMNSAKTSAKMDDGMVDSSGGMILSGPKGSIQLNKDDSVIAGTDLMGGSGKGGDISILASTLGNKMDQMIGKLDNLIGAVNKGMVVNLDGNRVSQELLTPLAISNRRT